MLGALITASRSSYLAKFDLKFRFFVSNDVYIERTKASRPTKSGSKNPRWVKSTLAQAGIDTAEFMVHSSRSASSSAAYEAGVALPEIMEAADWSTVSTFTKFYHKPVCKNSFANAVLGQTEQRSLAISSEE